MGSAKSTSSPVPLINMPLVSQGDARDDDGYGVYALQKGAKALVAYTTTDSFHDRVGGPHYSKAERVVGHLGSMSTLTVVN